MHHTGYFGDIGTSKIIEDLLKKDFVISIPFITNCSKYDLIADKDNKLYRIQCKYSSTGTWVYDKYNQNNIDYFAVYLSKVDKVVYPSIDCAGITIAQELPRSATPFYWWEDFNGFVNKNDLKKRNYREFGLSLLENKDNNPVKEVFLPSKEELFDLITKMSNVEIAKYYRC